jgi:hypothetical protein
MAKDQHARANLYYQLAGPSDDRKVKKKYSNPDTSYIIKLTCHRAKVAKTHQLTSSKGGASIQMVPSQVQFQC